jgi:hypothetical protein
VGLREIVRWGPALSKEMRCIKPLDAAPCHYRGK